MYEHRSPASYDQHDTEKVTIFTRTHKNRIYVNSPSHHAGRLSPLSVSSMWTGFSVMVEISVAQSLVKPTLHGTFRPVVAWKNPITCETFYGFMLATPRSFFIIFIYLSSAQIKVLHSVWHCTFSRPSNLHTARATQ